MTNELNSLPADEARWLDKLVDGELDDVQRRQLLMDLETQPDGWRRCALAFLEAQAWKDSLRGLAAPRSHDATPHPLRPASWWSHSWGTLLAAAASFLVAFGLGLVWRGQADPADPVAIARTEPAQPPSAKSTPAQPPELGLATDKPQWGTMTVALDRNSDGVLEPMELPVVRGPGIDEQWVRNQPLAIPSNMLRTLERLGHQVQHERQYYPFDLGDGGRVLVPVDELDVRYVGERQFQ
jgi:hypothetical protein